MKLEEGISVDFSNHTWIINIISEEFSDLELEYFSNSTKIYYNDFHLVPFFLIEIKDYLEISDVPFNLFEASDDVIESLEKIRNYDFKVNLLKCDGTIVASKSRTSLKEFDRNLKFRLGEILKKEYSEEAFEHELERIYQKYDPQAIFELCDQKSFVAF